MLRETILIFNGSSHHVHDMVWERENIDSLL